jgi:hypothetical protein
LAALAIAVRVDRCFESSWELLRYGLFKDLNQIHRPIGKLTGTAPCLTQLSALLALAIGGVFPTPIAALLALAKCRVLAATPAALRASTVRGVIPAPMIADRAAAVE